MTAQDYWYGDVWLAEGYQKADKLRQQRENVNAWLQGMYVYEGVAVALKNALKKKHEAAVKYPSKPYEIFPHEEEEDDEEKDRLKALLYMQSMVKAGQSWGKERK